MTPAPVSRYLADFDAEPEAAAPVAGLKEGLRRPPAETADSINARVEAAHVEGFESGRMAAQAGYEAKLGELKAAHAQQIAAARQAWALEEGGRLAERLTAGIQEMEARIVAGVARALEPLLAEGVRRKAVADLVQHIQVLIAKTPGVRLSIAGPEDLVAAVQKMLDGKACSLDVHPAAGSEVCVIADQTVLKTCLESWAANLAETPA